MTSQRLLYRALEGTNTKTRRLAYITAMISMLGRRDLSEQLLLSRLVRWSQEHKRHLDSYWVQTGEVTSTRRNAAGARYLELATKVGLVAPITGVYYVTRIGLVLYTLIGYYGINVNPFYLTSVERLFYTYWILTTDADLLLTVLDRIAQQTDVNLSQLQDTFQSDFLSRLEKKISVCQDEALRRRLLERRIKVSDEWQKPERYAEHLVPPRLNWLLDLGFLEADKFQRHHYALTTSGTRFLSALPYTGDGEFHDVTDRWLDSEYWNIAAKTLLDLESVVGWDQVGEEQRDSILKPLLRETFEAFRHTPVPKVSWTQAVLYLSVRLLVDHRVGANPSHLGKWLSVPRVMEGRRYEVRLSPRENESYLLTTMV